MNSEFMSEDFLLQSETACRLYHGFAEKMGIYDYHCHLPVEKIAADHNFENLTQAWLAGDHYKWRAMRTNGIDEKYCTGDASDYEKFSAWAETVPYCMGNPLYHWTHLELKRPFGIEGVLLGPDTAKGIYDSCSEMLASAEFSVRGIMKKMNVKLVCTTDGPLDSLEYHKKIASDGFDVKVYAAFRPDAGLAIEKSDVLNGWIDKLAEVSNVDIGSFESYIGALQNRHDYFHENGCRLSDYGLERAYADDYTDAEIERIFADLRAGKDIDIDSQLKFKSAMMYEFGLMDAKAGWVMQLHLGALRNNNTRLFNLLGADTGFDSIGDFEMAGPLSKFLDRLDKEENLAKTILYNLNPRDNELMATMAGNFQDGSCPGKIQYGSGWWFLDQKDGMEKQLTALSTLGLLSRFVGMLTDSRSFLSYPRHEYFRRILCNMVGGDVEAGLLPNDVDWLGEMIENVCFNNAAEYFPMSLG